MPTSPSVTDLGRQVVDEQLSLVRRWNDATDRYLDDLRRLADGEIDTVTFGREVAELAATEVVHSVEMAARVGLSYVQFVTGLSDPRRRRRSEPTSEAADGR